MEQLWYTWSPHGPNPGLQIRAKSPGLGERDERTSVLKQFIAYRLPEGTIHVEPPQAPVCLSFTNTSFGHILTHKVYKGFDTSNRPGVFFTHLVLLNEASKKYTLQDAINLWDSPFWRESENESDPRILPSI